MLRLFAGGVRALAEEAFRTRSSKVDWYDYSSNGSDDAADEAYIAAVDDLGYSEPYRDDVDYDARHPSPSCSRKESGAECEAQDSKDDDYVCELDWSCAHSCKTRGTSKEGEQASRSSHDRYYGDTDWSLRFCRRRLHHISISRSDDKSTGDIGLGSLGIVHRTSVQSFFVCPHGLSLPGSGRYFRPQTGQIRLGGPAGWLS